LGERGMNMELLTPGEKIKKLRRELGLKQDDLTNEEVSKSLISMIEGNKRGLTEGTANIIAQSLNRYYGSMEKTITPEYLLETPQEQIQKIVMKEKEELKELVESGQVNEGTFHFIFDKISSILASKFKPSTVIDFSCVDELYIESIFSSVFNKLLSSLSISIKKTLFI